MFVPTEIIILFFIISFLIYTMPMVLVKFSKTLKGKFLLLLLTIVITLYNRTGGILMAMLIIFLSEFNYEVNNGILYEGFDTPTEGPVTQAVSGPVIMPSAEPIASATGTDPTKKEKPDQLTVATQLQAINTSSIPVSQ